MTNTAFDLSAFSADQLQGLFQILQSHLNETPVEFSTQVQKVKEERVSKRMQELSVTVSHYETVNAAFEVALNEVLNDAKEARFIVTQLDKCRRNDDFRGMRSVYFKYAQKDLKVEEMLKTLCAIYRLKLKNYKHASDKSGDRAIVRHEIRCPECGEYARKLVEFLDIKGIKWADV